MRGLILCSTLPACIDPIYDLLDRGHEMPPPSWPWPRSASAHRPTPSCRAPAGRAAPRSPSKSHTATPGCRRPGPMPSCWPRRAPRGGPLEVTAAVAAPHTWEARFWHAVRAPARWWLRMAGGGSDRKKRTPSPRARPLPTPAPALSPPVAPPVVPAPAAPPLMPAPSDPPQKGARRGPARSWIAALPREEETQ
jgi:hypothetical protein